MMAASAGSGLARGVGHLAPVRARRVCRGRQVECAAGEGGDGDRIGGGGLVVLSETWAKPRGWNFSLFVYANCGG